MKALSKLLVLLTIASTPALSQDVTKKLVIMPNVCIVVDPSLPQEVGGAVLREPLSCPGIVLHPAIFNYPPSITAFGILHEYKHVELGHHLIRKDTLTLQQKIQREKDADCEAAKALTQGWPSLIPEFKRLIEDYLTPGPEHGAPANRAKFIISCLN